MWIDIWEEVHYTGVPCDQCEMSTDYEILDCQRVNRIIRLCGCMAAKAANEDAEIPTCAVVENCAGTCAHPHNMTPECHDFCCPLLTPVAATEHNGEAI